MDGALMKLARCNAHERDTRVWMDVEAHKYYVDGLQLSESISSLVHQFFTPFDARGTVDKYYTKWTQRGDYAKLILYLKRKHDFSDERCKEEICELWTLNGKCASERGTKVHEEIEKALNDVEYCRDYAEVLQFEDWKRNFADASGWEPYRTEWSIFSEDACIAGQIDSMWKDANGDLHMVDWKCCDPTPKRDGDPPDLLGPNMRCFQNKRGIAYCSDLPDTKYGHYALQQNAYKYILESCYGVRVSSMHLLQMHPTLDSYHMIQLEEIQPVIRKIFDDRIAATAVMHQHESASS